MTMMTVTISQRMSEWWLETLFARLFAAKTAAEVAC